MRKTFKKVLDNKQMKCYNTQAVLGGSDAEADRRVKKEKTFKKPIDKASDP